MATKPPSKAPRLGEFSLIEKIFAPLASKMPGAYGLKDDAAVLAVPPESDIVVTTDALVEGVHFLRQDPPDLISQKALRVNLSDLAAKGAAPHSYFLALSLPDWTDDAWLRQFAVGLASDQERYGIVLGGGDTTRTPGPLTIAITAHGILPKGSVIRRGGAKSGDAVFVTGTIGDAGAGLAVLMGAAGSLSQLAQTILIGRYRLPDPHMAFGLCLRGLASSALDVSDGLLADLAHIAEVSKVRIVVEAGRIPLSDSVRALWGADAAARAAVAGDDYEIAFTVPTSLCDQVQETARLAGINISKIGRVEAGEGVLLLREDGPPIPLERLGFTHF